MKKLLKKVIKKWQQSAAYYGSLSETTTDQYYKGYLAGKANAREHDATALERAITLPLKELEQELKNFVQ